MSNRSAARLNSMYLTNGKTTKAEVVRLFGEPGDISRDQSGNEKYIYEKNGTRLDVTFKNDVVWSSHEDSAN
jgi:hypothetical protein